MVYAMPKRKEYQDAKYQETTFFNEGRRVVDRLVIVPSEMNGDQELQSVKASDIVLSNRNEASLSNRNEANCRKNEAGLDLQYAQPPVVYAVTADQKQYGSPNGQYGSPNGRYNS